MYRPGPSCILGTSALIAALTEGTEAHRFLLSHARQRLMQGNLVVSAASLMQTNFFLRSITDPDHAILTGNRIRDIVNVFRSYRAIVDIGDRHVDFLETRMRHAFSYVDSSGRPRRVSLSERLVWATAIVGVYAPNIPLVDYEIPSVHRFLVVHYGLSFCSLGPIEAAVPQFGGF